MASKKTRSKRTKSKRPYHLGQISSVTTDVILELVDLVKSRTGCRLRTQYRDGWWTFFLPSTHSPSQVAKVKAILNLLAPEAKAAAAQVNRT